LDDSAPGFQFGADLLHPAAGKRVAADGKEAKHEKDDRNPDIEKPKGRESARRLVALRRSVEPDHNKVVRHSGTIRSGAV